MSSKLKIAPGIYEHYKGRRYKVIGIARHSENPKQQFVVYRALYDSKDFGPNQIWIRPLDMFIEDVEVDSKTRPRFKLISEK